MPPPPRCTINEAQERYKKFKEIISGVIDDAGRIRILDHVQKEAIVKQAQEAYENYTNCFDLGFGRPEHGPIPLSDVERGLMPRRGGRRRRITRRRRNISRRRR